MERNDLDIRREQERVEALAVEHANADDGEFLRGFLEGARQALQWVMLHVAISPSDRIAIAAEEASTAAVQEQLNGAVKDGQVEMAGFVDGEPTYRMTDVGRREIEAKIRAAGVDPNDKDAVLHWMKGE